MQILWTLLIGLVIGVLARWIKPGRDSIGWIMTALIGVGGALLAKYIGQQMGWYGQYDKAGLLASVGGAIVLLFVYETLTRLAARREPQR
jgi:uncharacterized membrane protein YeaQ/YmgE (transglycosylase-associated protein family)